MKNSLLILTVLGFIIPYSVLILFIVDHGFDISLLFDQIFASYGSTFFALDVILTALVIIYLAATNNELAVKKYYVICIALLVGPSCALPLYLLLNKRVES